MSPFEAASSRIPLPSVPQGIPQDPTTPTPRTTPDPYALDEGPRHIPGEPRITRRGVVRHPDTVDPEVMDYLRGRANSNLRSPLDGQRRQTTVDALQQLSQQEVPYDPTLPAQPLMPEVVEHRHRVQSVDIAGSEQPAAVRLDQLSAEMEACAEAMNTLIQALRRGERPTSFEQQVPQLIERSRRLLAQARADAGRTLSVEALDKKCTPLEQVIEEEGRVLQWMYATVGVTNARPSTEALFRARADAHPQELQAFFRTIVDELDGIRIRAEQLGTQPVPPAVEVIQINTDIQTAGARIAQFLALHPFADTLASPMVFGYARALKALGDTLTVEADNQPYASRIDQLSSEHRVVLKKIADYFASTSGHVVLQLDEQNAATTKAVA